MGEERPVDRFRELGVPVVPIGEARTVADAAQYISDDRAGSHWCALCEWSDHDTDHCPRAVGVRIVETGTDAGDAELLHKRSGEILPDGRILVTDPEDIARLRLRRADIDADLERRPLARAGEHRVPRRGWCERLTGWLSGERDVWS